MRIADAFPSTHLRHADLQGRRVVVTIERIVIETLGQGDDKDTKPVAYFVGAKKGLGLNKTNAFEIAMAYGEETDGWIGKQIELFPSITPYKGVPTPCIRVRPIYPAGPSGVIVAPQPVVQPNQPPPNPAFAHPMQAPFNAGPGEQAAAGADPFGDSSGDPFGDSPPF